MKENLASIKQIILDLFFPKICINCGRKGDYICEDCLSLIDILDHQYCPGCRKITPEGKICQSCKKFLKLDRLYFASSYKNPLVKEAISKLKYEPFCKELSEPLANLIITHFQILGNIENFLEKSEYVLVPVPLDKRRLKWRGFNQAECLAKELSKVLKVPLISDCLIKIKETLPQVELKEEKRKENIKGVFLIKNKEKIRKKKVLLVDDVYTTGSTLNECARVLKIAGAKEVFGVVIARE